MKTMVLCSFIVILLVSATACNELFSFEKKATEPVNELTGVVWQLESFQEIDGKTTGVGSENIMLIFTEDSLKGQAFPKEGPRTHGNSYGGLYKINPTEALSIDLRFSTEMGTLPGSRYEEYLQALRDAFRYEIEGSQLRIYYDSKVLNFKVRQDGS
ncbi:hypothetical protein AWN76_011680 [Rhodothermaceae bacterium RA]|nr:hypothetical protein AWN76_011680 [Rhodothermaceae bacterium RA]